MATYAVACTLQIPIANDEHREVSAVAEIASWAEGVGFDISLDSDSATMLDLPSNYRVYLKSYVVYLPTPGPTQLALDAELRLALGEHGWVVQ